MSRSHFFPKLHFSSNNLINNSIESFAPELVTLLTYGRALARPRHMSSIIAQAAPELCPLTLASLTRHNQWSLSCYKRLDFPHKDVRQATLMLDVLESVFTLSKCEFNLRPQCSSRRWY